MALGQKRASAKLRCDGPPVLFKSLRAGALARWAAEL